jgi:hypothetical protein
VEATTLDLAVCTGLVRRTGVDSTLVVVVTHRVDRTTAGKQLARALPGDAAVLRAGHAIVALVVEETAAYQRLAVDALALQTLVLGANLAIIAMGVFSTTVDSLRLVDTGKRNALVDRTSDPIVALARE